MAFIYRKNRNFVWYLFGGPHQVSGLASLLYTQRSLLSGFRRQNAVPETDPC